MLSAVSTGWNIIGTIGEICFLVGLIITNFIPSDKPVKFLKRNKAISHAFCTLVAVGFIYYALNIHKLF